MRTLTQRLYAPALVISLPVAFVIALRPALGIPLALFWLLAPQWLLIPYRRAQTGSLPHLTQFLERWTNFLRWSPWLYWLMALMWTAFGSAAWLTYPEEPTFRWFTPLFAGGSAWLLWRIFRVFRIPVAEMPHLVPVPRTAEPRLWQEIESIAAQLGVRPPLALAFDWWGHDAIIFEPVLAQQGERLQPPVLVLSGVGFETRSCAELRSVIGHELAHLRHRDHYLLALHKRATTWASWASHVGSRLSVGEDTTELWSLIADYPYGLDLHLDPLRQQIEFACDRAAAAVTSPEHTVQDLLKVHSLEASVEESGTGPTLVWHAHWNTDLDALAGSAHPTMSQRAKALGVDQAKVQARLQTQPIDGGALSFLDGYPAWRNTLIATHAWRFLIPDDQTTE